MINFQKSRIDVRVPNRLCKSILKSRSGVRIGLANGPRLRGADYSPLLLVILLTYRLCRPAEGKRTPRPEQALHPMMLLSKDMYNEYLTHPNSTNTLHYRPIFTTPCHLARLLLLPPISLSCFSISISLFLLSSYTFACLISPADRRLFVFVP